MDRQQPRHLALDGRVRRTGTAVSHNVTMALLGGTAPLAVTWLIALTGDAMLPAHYLMLAALVSGNRGAGNPRDRACAARLIGARHDGSLCGGAPVVAGAGHPEDL